MTGRVTLGAAFVSMLLLASAAARSQAEISSLTGIIEGHEVGGMTVDWTGSIYSADFGDIVWRLTPEGERREFASGLYGTSGNAIDHQGMLLQSSFYGDTISRIDRKGQARPFVSVQRRRVFLWCDELQCWHCSQRALCMPEATIPKHLPSAHRRLRAVLDRAIQRRLRTMRNIGCWRPAWYAALFAMTCVSAAGAAAAEPGARARQLAEPRAAVRERRGDDCRRGAQALRPAPICRAGSRRRARTGTGTARKALRSRSDRRASRRPLAGHTSREPTPASPDPKHLRATTCP